ncbi:unnamed protein product [Gongylonema pulchrum]|uniref:Secreted protein n=1 Tax=Gongylonema pulchrum TaxID=637853 RepID=A0A183E354_9BILA|nr:unnamed protein product [Gongylonema pulchrum]
MICYAFEIFDAFVTNLQLVLYSGDVWWLRCDVISLCDFVNYCGAILNVHYVVAFSAFFCSCCCDCWYVTVQKTPVSRVTKQKNSGWNAPGSPLRPCVFALNS